MVVTADEHVRAHDAISLKLHGHVSHGMHLLLLCYHLGQALALEAH